MLRHIISAIQERTPFVVIAGGASLPIEFHKGTIVVSQIASETITRADRHFKAGAMIQSSMLKNTYQLDFYKVNTPNLDYIEAHTEAERIREILKAPDIATYLNARGGELLPAFGAISFLSELSERKELVNRASFEIQAVIAKDIIQEADNFAKIDLQVNTIIGG